MSTLKKYIVKLPVYAESKESARHAIHNPEYLRGEIKVKRVKDEAECIDGKLLYEKVLEIHEGIGTWHDKYRAIREINSDLWYDAVQQKKKVTGEILSEYSCRLVCGIALYIARGAFDENDKLCL